MFNCGPATNCQLVQGVTHDPEFSRKMVLKMEGWMDVYLPKIFVLCSTMIKIH